MKEFKKGDRVFVESTYGSSMRTYWATVHRVGSRWTWLGNHSGADRFENGTRYLDGRGYRTPGIVYADEREYENSVSTKRCVAALRERFRYGYDERSIELSKLTLALRVLGMCEEVEKALKFD